MSATKLTAYAVSLVFGSGPIFMNLLCAPSSESAVAISAVRAVRELQTEEELSGVSVMPIPVEWVRTTLRILEGGEPVGAQVLSLVPQVQPERISQEKRADWPTDHPETPLEPYGPPMPEPPPAA